MNNSYHVAPLFSLLLLGCQSSPHPFDGVSGFQRAELLPDATVVSIVGDGGESWKSLNGKLTELCQSTYPGLGKELTIKVLGKQEFFQPVTISFPAAFTGAGGPDSKKYPIPNEPNIKAQQKALKILALCQAVKQP